MEDDFGRLLAGLARNAIAAGLDMEAPCALDRGDARLSEPGASFVTLTMDGELRGCIGTLVARRPLGLDVEENAAAAAFEDPRFDPLGRGEFARVRIEISLLDPPRPMEFEGEADALRRLVPGKDGIVLSFGARRATFLPQVWEQLPDPADFMRHLKLKAGLPAEFWSRGIALSRYSVRKWSEGSWQS